MSGGGDVVYMHLVCLSNVNTLERVYILTLLAYLHSLKGINR